MKIILSISLLITVYSCTQQPKPLPRPNYSKLREDAKQWVIHQDNPDLVIQKINSFSECKLYEFTTVLYWRLDLVAEFAEVVQETNKSLGGEYFRMSY